MGRNPLLLLGVSKLAIWAGMSLPWLLKLYSYTVVMLHSYIRIVTSRWINQSFMNCHSSFVAQDSCVYHLIFPRRPRFPCGKRTLGSPGRCLLDSVSVARAEDPTIWRENPAVADAMFSNTQRFLLFRFQDFSFARILGQVFHGISIPSFWDSRKQLRSHWFCMKQRSWQGAYTYVYIYIYMYNVYTHDCSIQKQFMHVYAVWTVHHRLVCFHWHRHSPTRSHCLKRCQDEPRICVSVYIYINMWIHIYIYIYVCVHNIPSISYGTHDLI